MKLPLAERDVAVLVGGEGTRLRPVIGELPKPLAPVCGRPFLFYMLDMLAIRGARSVTLCCGYRADLVQEKIGTNWLGMPVHYSIEQEALGTGGALSLAARTMETERILALNGDSWFEPNWVDFLERSNDFTAAIAAVRVSDSSRYGSLQIESDSGRIVAFLEKHPSNRSPGFINSGVYDLDRNWIAQAAQGPCSLERDLFPLLAAKGQLGGVPYENDFLDIGIPAAYQEADSLIKRLGIAPHKMFPDFPDMSSAQVKLGAAVVIRNESGNVLLERRSDCGWWCVVGGKMDAGETIQACAVREAFEETGLHVKLGEFLGIFSDPTRRTVCYPDNGDLRQLVDAAWIAEPTVGLLQKSFESLDLAWFPPTQIPLNTAPPAIEILRAALC